MWHQPARLQGLRLQLQGVRARQHRQQWQVVHVVAAATVQDQIMEAEQQRPSTSGLRTATGGSRSSSLASTLKLRRTPLPTAKEQPVSAKATLPILLLLRITAAAVDLHALTGLDEGTCPAEEEGVRVRVLAVQVPRGTPFRTVV